MIIFRLPVRSARKITCNLDYCRLRKYNRCQALYGYCECLEEIPDIEKTRPITYWC